MYTYRILMIGAAVLLGLVLAGGWAMRARSQSAPPLTVTLVERREPEPGDQVIRYEFQLEDGVSASDVRLTLTGADGEQLALSTAPLSGGRLVLHFDRLLETGTYMLRVQAHDGREAVLAIEHVGPAPGTTLLSADFSDGASSAGLVSIESGGNSTSVEMGEFVFRSQLQSTPQLLNFGNAISNATVSVEVRLVGATEGRSAQIGCRARALALDFGYVLRVYPSGNLRGDTFELVRSAFTADDTVLASGATAAVQPGEESNLIELTCVGTTISAAINGVEVASIQDSSVARGTPTIGIGPAPGPVDARFDNLILTQR